jgi:plastocyanin
MRRAALGVIVIAALALGIAPNARAQSASITIQNYAFSPNSLTVPVGTTVQWTNEDPVAHTVTSTTGAFDSGVLQHLGHFSFTFSQPGTYDYYCQIHDYMRGTIIVTSAGGPPTSTATSMPTAPPGPTNTAPAGGPTATPTVAQATDTPAPAPTDTSAPPTPTATSTSGSTSPGTLHVAVSGTLKAGRSAALTVTVTNARSRPVKGAQIRADLSGAGVKAVKKGKTDSHGRARMTLAPKRVGSVRIRVSKSGYRTKTVSVKVRA